MIKYRLNRNSLVRRQALKLTTVSRFISVKLFQLNKSDLVIDFILCDNQVKVWHLNFSRKNKQETTDMSSLNKTEANV